MATQKKLKRLNYAPGMDPALQRNFELINDNFTEVFKRLGDKPNYSIGSTFNYDNATAHSSATTEIPNAHVTFDMTVGKPLLIFLSMNPDDAILSGAPLHPQLSINNESTAHSDVTMLLQGYEAANYQNNSIGTRIWSWRLSGQNSAAAHDFGPEFPMCSIFCFHIPRASGNARFQLKWQGGSSYLNSYLEAITKAQLVAVQLL